MDMYEKYKDSFYFSKYVKNYLITEYDVLNQSSTQYCIWVIKDQRTCIE